MDRRNGPRPFLSRATAFHVSRLAKKHANSSAPDKIHERERKWLITKILTEVRVQSAHHAVAPASPTGMCVWKTGERKPFLKAVSDGNTVRVRGTGTNHGEKPIPYKLGWSEFTKDIWEIKKKKALKNHELPVQNNNRYLYL